MSEAKRPMLNEALRLVRLYWGYSQSEMASELGLSQSMISEIERGIKTPSIEVISRYSSKLDIRMSQLMFFAEELEGEPVMHKGKLIVANRVLALLDKLAPNEVTNAH